MDCSSGARYSIFSRNSVPPFASSRRLNRTIFIIGRRTAHKILPQHAVGIQLTVRGNIRSAGAFALVVSGLAQRLFPLRPLPHTAGSGHPLAAWRPKWIKRRVPGSSVDICSKVWLTLPSWLVIQLTPVICSTGCSSRTKPSCSCIPQQSASG